ncbi:MAG: hypothetical protein ABI939_09260, partial [Anaerolineaceae bacterium]
YELLCSARSLDNEKFAPVLVVAKQAWPRRPREIDVPHGPYVNEEEAIEAAHKKGIEWIHEYG